ncbi:MULTISPECIES: methyltransferase domain-containing protein [unclassified Moraxella]|uniref:methyltransferase domain-containing protein n=1 Tax=unclassified Moraxella TaxID=2685852 RepID=UPI003AF98F36
MIQDRNFDDISEHFEKKIYGGLKGQIRLAVLRRDILEWVATAQTRLNRPLRVLDVGAGLAQISIELAKNGYDVTINDISANMLDIAKHHAKTELGDLTNNITWHTCPYQDLNNKLSGKYDLILCHAVLEWLASPADIMDFFDNWLADDGGLSLCFYNPASFVYRNLVMGNFNLLNKTDFEADNKSLTPNNPVAKDEVLAWLAKRNYRIVRSSGLRVFHDYSPLKRGGHTNPQAVIEMEVKYSDQEPYKWLGRYLHFMVEKVKDS